LPITLKRRCFNVLFTDSRPLAHGLYRTKQRQKQNNNDERAEAHLKDAIGEIEIKRSIELCYATFIHDDDAVVRNDRSTLATHKAREQNKSLVNNRNTRTEDDEQ
jgi:hypothetical protein